MWIYNGLHLFSPIIKEHKLFMSDEPTTILSESNCGLTKFLALQLFQFYSPNNIVIFIEMQNISQQKKNSQFAKQKNIKYRMYWHDRVFFSG